MYSWYPKLSNGLKDRVNLLSPIIYRYINPIISKYFKFVIKRRSEDLAFQRNTILSKYNVSLVLDVGAHYGETVKEIRSNGYTKKIISIEPTPKSFDILSRIKDKSFYFFNIAFGEKPGLLRFYEFEDSDMNSFLEVKTNTSYQINQLGVGRLIECTTLDIFMEDNNLENEVIFLKLDVQGFELNILKGLKKYKDKIIALQVEISINSIYKSASNLEDFSKWLIENDFRIISIVTERFHETETQAYDVDILCLRINSSMI